MVIAITSDRSDTIHKIRGASLGVIANSLVVMDPKVHYVDIIGTISINSPDDIEELKKDLDLIKMCLINDTPGDKERADRKV